MPAPTAASAPAAHVATGLAASCAPQLAACAPQLAACAPRPAANVLADEDFFGVECEDVSKMNLADRVNLH